MLYGSQNFRLFAVRSRLAARLTRALQDVLYRRETPLFESREKGRERKKLLKCIVVSRLRHDILTSLEQLKKISLSLFRDVSCHSNLLGESQFVVRDLFILASSFLFPLSSPQTQSALLLSIHTHTRMYPRISISIHTHTHIYIYISIHIHIHIYTYIHTCTCLGTHSHRYLSILIHPCTSIQTHTFIFTDTPRRSKDGQPQPSFISLSYPSFSCIQIGRDEEIDREITAKEREKERRDIQMERINDEFSPSLIVPMFVGSNTSEQEELTGA